MIKKMLFLSGLLILICNCTPKTNTSRTIISGTITNNSEDILTIVGNDHFRDTIKVDDAGHFKDTIDLMPGSYLFSYGKLFWRTYLQNGYDLNLSFNTQDFSKSLTYTGKGSGENHYLFDKIKKQRETMQVRQKAITQINDSSLILLKNQKEILSQFLTEYNDLPEAFKELEQRNIDYGYLSDLKRLEALDTLHQVSGLHKQLQIVTTDLDYNRGMDYLFSGSYKRIVEQYYNDNAQQTAKAALLDNDIAFLKEISKISNDTIRNSLAYNHAKYGITYTNDLETFHSLFLKTSTNTTYNKEITANYTILKKVAKGAASPDFRDYENYHGGTTSLSDLKGSYLFIDVWATWCGPCRKEIPYLKKLEEAYHGKNITFVSISIDKHEDREKWKQMIKDKDLGGVQLLADNDWESFFIKDYLIKGIPRFIIIDPEGFIIDYNAPVPSSGELEKIFDEFKL